VGSLTCTTLFNIASVDSDGDTELMFFKLRSNLCARYISSPFSSHLRRFTMRNENLTRTASLGVVPRFCSAK
jgi:hypothetical protein